jgi:hypothetical protein
MPSAVRTRLTYANVVATLALVFAMSGGALAATHYLITSTKQISPKVLKELRGKEGAAGVAGGAGVAGAPGKEGGVGKAGANGTDGSNGESVLVSELAPGSECKEGGSQFEVGGKSAHVCNGARGKEGKEGASVVNTKIAPSQTNPECKEGGAEFKVGSGTATYACNGKEGSPWTDKGVLPPDATETGTWGFSVDSNLRRARVPISFPIPLSKGLETVQCGTEASTCHIHIIKPGQTGAAGKGCEGGTDAVPTAEPGNLCIYIKEVEAVNEEFVWENPEGGGGVGTTGVVLGIETLSETEGGEGQGTWAVRENES